MSARALFLSTEGRLARKPFWLGLLALFAAVVAVNAVAVVYDAKAVAASPPPLWYRAGAFLVMAVIAWPTYALLAKRLHDRGQSARAAMAYSGLVLLLHGVDVVYRLETGKNQLLWPAFVIGVPLALVLIALLIEGVRAGDAGPNDYGPDPLQGRADPREAAP